MISSERRLERLREAFWKKKRELKELEHKLETLEKEIVAAKCGLANMFAEIVCKENAPRV